MGSKDYEPIINQLPAIYRENSEFLEPFLRAFEELLLGLPVDVPEEDREAYLQSRGTLQSIRQILKRQADYFDAYKTPPQFLEWLAGWVGYKFKLGEEFNHPDDSVENKYESPTLQHIPLNEKRESYNRFFISRMVSVYQNRGTAAGIKNIINDYLANINYGSVHNLSEKVEVRIDEYLEPFVLGSDNSYLGQHSVLGVPRPHYFRILILTDGISYGEEDDNQDSENIQEQIKKDVEMILDEEKPAHVYYFLTITDIKNY